MNDHEPTGPDFGKLRKLLAFKRHEAPPPGYFDRLPAQIMARIEALEERKKRGWWERWLARPLSHPAVGWAYASLAVALVIGGVVVGQHVKARSQANATHPAEGGPASPALPASGQSMVVADTNRNSAPPGFLVQPGGLRPDTTGGVERVGFTPQ